MAITLWIDTASSGCNIAITQGQKVLSAQFTAMQRGQAEILLPMLDDCLKQAKLSLGDISKIIAARGPGSFTGVRIGLACAKTLALCLNIPLKTVTNFDLLYWAYYDHCHLNDHNCILSLDSFRFEPFIQIIADGKALAPQVANSSELLDQIALYQCTMVLGDTSLDFWQDTHFTCLKQYDAKDVCLLEKLLMQGKYVGCLPLDDDQQAFYIRDADVSISQRQHKTISENHNKL